MLPGDFLFLDESGDTGLGPKSTPFFAIAILHLRSRNALARVIRRARRKALGRGAPVSEIKWSSSSDKLRWAVVDQVCREAAHVGGLAAAVMEKSWISPVHAQRREYIRYNYCVRLAMEKGGLFEAQASGRRLQVTIDGRNRHATETLDEYIGLLRASGDLCCEVSLKAGDSMAIPQLQVADFLAGAVCAAFIRGDWSFYNALKRAGVRIETRMLRGR